MSTPQDWIAGALKDLGAIDGSSALSSDELSDGRKKLNLMLDSFNTEGLLINAYTRTTKLMTGSDGTYTIGTGGDINVPQPVLIESAAVIAVGQTLERPLDILTTEVWASLSDKTSLGLPVAIYFQKSSSVLGTIYPFPVPDQAHTLVLYLGTQLSSVAESALSTDYSLPPGYEEAIQSNLAVRLAPSYAEVGAPDFAAMVEIAAMTKANIARANLEPITATVEDSLRQLPRTYNILSGEYN